MGSMNDNLSSLLVQYIMVHNRSLTSMRIWDLMKLHIFSICTNKSMDNCIIGIVHGCTKMELTSGKSN